MISNKLAKRFSQLLAVVLVTSALGACSIFDSDERFEPADLTDYVQTVQGSIVWQTPIGSEGAYGFAPIVLGDSVYAATPDGHVARVALANGHPQFNIDLDTELAAGVGTDGQLLAVTTRDGRVIALNANTGEKLWEVRSSTISSTPPVVGSGLVIVRADDYRVQAFNQANGELMWNYLRANAPLTLRGRTRMLLLGDTVLVPVPIGRLVALQTQTGKLVWDLKVAQPVGANDLDAVTDVVGLPVLTNQSLCVATYQGNASCYSGMDAQGEPALRWAKPYSSPVGIGLGPQGIYATGMYGEVTGFAGAGGDMLWQDDTLRNRGLTAPVIVNNILYVGDYEGYVHFYNAQTGKLEGRMSVGDDPITSPLTVTPVGVLVQNGDGSLVMIGAK